MIKKNVLFAIIFNLLTLIPRLLLGENDSNDFELLMGKGAVPWQYVETAEDRRRLDFFKKLFVEQISLLEKEDEARHHIPKKIHFVWLGPNEFPLKAIKNVEKWIRLHPGWEVFFWTDIEGREPPVGSMIKREVQSFPFRFLSHEYDLSDNFGEKAKILSYEILFEEGGLCLEHDVKAMKTFDQFHKTYDFYCGLEEPQSTILSTSIYPALHLIAAKPRHPILAETCQWLKKQWNPLENAYLGFSKLAIKNRVMHRVHWALMEGIECASNLFENRDIIFPATYFSLSKRKASSFTIHTRDESWLQKEKGVEKKMMQQLDKVVHKNNEILIWILLLSTLNFGALYFLWRFSKTT